MHLPLPSPCRLGPDELLAAPDAETRASGPGPQRWLWWLDTEPRQTRPLSGFPRPLWGHPLNAHQPRGPGRGSALGDSLAPASRPAVRSPSCTLNSSVRLGKTIPQTPIQRAGVRALGDLGPRVTALGDAGAGVSAAGPDAAALPQWGT